MITFFTIQELEAMSNGQLEELYTMLHRWLPMTEEGSALRRNILASLENIDQVRNRRRACLTLLA